jgi:hypothetical protein
VTCAVPSRFSGFVKHSKVKKFSRKDEYLTVLRAIVDVSASATLLHLLDHFMADGTKWI